MTGRSGSCSRTAKQVDARQLRHRNIADHHLDPTLRHPVDGLLRRRVCVDLVPSIRQRSGKGAQDSRLVIDEVLQTMLLPGEIHLDPQRFPRCDLSGYQASTSMRNGRLALTFHIETPACAGDVGDLLNRR